MTDHPRQAALNYFEVQWKLSKRLNDDDKEYLEQAVNALRRSEDKTAMQGKLNAAMSVLRELVRGARLSAYDNATYIVDYTILDAARNLIPADEDQPKRRSTAETEGKQP